MNNHTIPTPEDMTIARNFVAEWAAFCIEAGQDVMGSDISAATKKLACALAATRQVERSRCEKIAADEACGCGSNTAALIRDTGYRGPTYEMIYEAGRKAGIHECIGTLGETSNIVRATETVRYALLPLLGESKENSK